MAAKMKLCRCLSVTNTFFAIFLLLQKPIDISCATTVAANTTDAANTTVASTTPTATPTTSTTPDPTTSTLPPTTTIAPNQPKTDIGDTVIGQCLCDVTGNECDINCCCDEQCTPADTATFVCNSVSVIVDNKKCYQEELFLFSNSPAETKTENGLFCIYFDNYNERNFYLDPDFVLDMPSFNTYLNDYGTPGVQQPLTVEDPVYTLNSFYSANNPVYIVYPNDARGDFVLPRSLSSSECTDQSPMPYLQELSTQCTRLVTTLTQDTCEQTASLSAVVYYTGFRVVKTPGLFGYIVNGTFIGVSTTAAPVPTAAATTAATTADPGNSTATTVPTTTPAPTSTTAAPTTVDPGQVQSLFNNPYTLEIDATTRTHLCVQTDGSLQACTFTTVPSPAFVAGTTCNDVVQQVRYFITTNGTSGISRMEVQFVFQNITADNIPLSQQFSVAYNTLADGNDTFAKSGNPGYLIGKPVLYGTLVSNANADGTETQVIEMATDPSLSLTVVRATALGECDMTVSSRVPIKFGENMRTGCFTQLALSSITNQADCDTIQEAIIAALEGPNAPVKNAAGNAWVDNNRYVATFGNTLATKVGDWLKIISNNRPPPGSATQTDDTCRLRMGVHIQVLYANVGALANPQAKIIGVALLYDDQRDVTIRCTGAYCQDTTGNLTQKFEVSQTVSFIDVSQPATMFKGEAPIFIAKLPSDFFYPFLYYTSAAAPVYNAQLVMVTILACFVTVLSRSGVTFT